MDIRSDLSFANLEDLNTKKFLLMSRGLGLHAVKIFSYLEIRQTVNGPSNMSESVYTKSIILGSIGLIERSSLFFPLQETQQIKPVCSSPPDVYQKDNPAWDSGRYAKKMEN
jgi:hypothetical protein